MKRLCRYLCRERSRHTQACFSGRQDSRCVCLPGQASGAVGGRGARSTQVHGLGRHQLCRSETTHEATASKTQAHEAGERQAGFWSGVRQGRWFSCSQDRLIWQHTSCSTVFSARPKRDFTVMCAVGCDGSSSTENDAEPYNIWNALLAALVHYRVGGAAVAANRAGYGQGGAVVRGAPRLGRGRAWLTQSISVWQTGVAADSQRRAGEGSPGWGHGAPARSRSDGAVSCTMSAFAFW